MKCRTLMATAMLAFVASACDDESPGDPNNPGDPPDVTGPVATMALAGNVVTCPAAPLPFPANSNAELTAQVIDTLPAETIVVPLGDIVILNGGAESYQRCYDPTWGRFKARTRAVVGNHEGAGVANAAHFQYFGSAAGPAGRGWYSFDAASWHVIVLNVHDMADYATGSEQMLWLAADLAANMSKTCTIAIWHDPYFLSSNTPGFTVRTDKKRIWDALYDAGADVVVNGGQHQYERMRPMNPDGNVDNTNGIVEFNSGAGGASWTTVSVVHPNQAAYRPGFGVLVLKLRENGYDYTFVSTTNPGAGNDSGSGACH